MNALIEGRHYFDIPTPAPTQRTMSFGIWPAVFSKQGCPKKGKVIVVIRAPVAEIETARLVAEYVRDQLDHGIYRGHKHVDLEMGPGQRLLAQAKYKPYIRGCVNSVVRGSTPETNTA